MKINWNKQYTTYAIYASLVLAAIIFCIFCGVYITSIWNGILFVIDVFSPLIYGCIIAYVLLPLLNLFERTIFFGLKRSVVRRGLSVALTYIVFLTVLVLAVYAIAPQLVRSLNDLQSNLIMYSDSLQKWLDDMSNKSGIIGSAVNYLKNLIDFDAFSQPLSFIIESVYELIREFSPYIVEFLGLFVVQVKNILIGLVFSGYILCSKELIAAQMNKFMHIVFKPERIKRISRATKVVDKTFGKYLMGMFFDAIIVGVLTAIAMLIFRIPYVPLISVLIACTNIIPIFGPFIGAIPSFIFIFISDPIKALWFLVIILVIQQIDGNIIAPRVLGDSTGLPAIAVIIAITVMGGLFGMVGMVIGVPVIAIIGKFVAEKTRLKYKSKREAAVAVGVDIEKKQNIDVADNNDTSAETLTTAGNENNSVSEDTEEDGGQSR